MQLVSLNMWMLLHFSLGEDHSPTLCIQGVIQRTHNNNISLSSYFIINVLRVNIAC